MKIPSIPLGGKTLLCTALLLTQAQAYAQGNLIWSDEFEGDRIDHSIWSYKVGGDGNGNGELQYYTANSKNAYVDDGKLVIEALRENYEGKQFTSARLHTNGRMGFKYGSLEARIKTPDLGNGLWPAFWMLGNNFGAEGWPKSGEWDILEAGSKAAQDAGAVNTTVSAALHWWHESGDWSEWLQADFAQETTVAVPLNESFHTYRLDWTPTNVTISVDGNPYFAMDITDPNMSEFRDNPAHVILNMAVGGFNFVEIPDAANITAPFPAKMEIDYVRLYDNEYTELSLPPACPNGNYGVMTDFGLVERELNWGDKTNLYIWNNMTPVAAEPLEGSTVLSYEIAPGDWFGMGLLHKDINLTGYEHGYLHMDVKTASQGDFSINFGSTSGGEGSVNFNADSETYGLARNGEWSHVAIPLSKFGSIDFANVKTLFSLSGPGPAETMTIAVDNIYLSPSVELDKPEFGNFSIYSENPANGNAGSFGFGVNGDLFLWADSVVLQPGEVLEGNASLNLQSTGQGWFGMGLTAREGFNLSAYDNDQAKLHFSMKSSDQTEFHVGVKSGSIDGIGQAWFKFIPGNDPYGFARDGQWHDIEIPVASFAKDVDLNDVRQVLQVLGLGEVTSLAIDNVYMSGGTAAGNVCESGPVPPRPPLASMLSSDIGAAPGSLLTFDGSKSQDLNGTAITHSWDFGDGTTDTGAVVNHEYAEAGSYTVTLTVDNGDFTAVTKNYIVIDENFGASKSAKRGLGYGHHSVEDLAVISKGMSWWYNWAIKPDVQVANVYQDYGMEFVPMAWNGGFDDAAMREYIAAHPDVKYILAFNEPNFIDQANMTPSQAAAEWPRLEAIADEFNLKIVSVAMNFCGNCVTENGTTYYDPIAYFDDFFAACPDCRVDAMSIHAYMENAGGVEWYVNLFKKYGRPIWLTEFSAWDDTTTLEDQKKFLVQVVDSLENDEDVERYAWFVGRRNGHPFNGLFDYRQSGVLAELGSIYVNMPQHGNAAKVHNLPGLVEAENYSYHSGLRPEMSTDSKGFLSLVQQLPAEGEAAPEYWVEYKLNAAAGNHALDFRVASASGGSMALLLDGAQVATVVVPATGGADAWADVSSALNLSAGNHTLRLVLSGDVSLNNFTAGGEGTPPIESSDDLALNKPAQASSHEGDNTAAAMAFDGDAGSRWSSAFEDNQWISVDLGSVQSVAKVVLGWEGAYGKSYRIDVSDDGMTWHTAYTTNSGVGGEDIIDQLSVNGNAASGRYVRMYGIERGTGYGFSLWNFEVYGTGGTNPDTNPPSGANLAKGKSASATSQEGGYWLASYATDGDSNTRWASDANDNQAITVDLGSVQNLSKVVLKWEAAFGKSFNILVSSDGSNWAHAGSVLNGSGGTDEIAISTPARFVKMEGITRGTGYGYSLWEFEVY